MAPLLPLLVTLAMSFGAGSAFAFEDDGYGSAKYYAEQERQHEQRMQQYRAEEQAAQYRNEQAAQEFNKPQSQPEPSWVNPTPSFGVYSGNSMQVCRQAGNSIYCY